MAVLTRDVAEAMESLMFERGIKDDDGEMYGGDLLKFQWEAVVRAARNKGRWLPASYNIDSPFQLVPPSIADTTDRTLEFRSKPRGFDNGGFAASAPPAASALSAARSPSVSAACILRAFGTLTKINSLQCSQVM